MSSYIVVESNVLDANKLKQYGQLAAPTVANHGGKFLIKGKVAALHGQNQFSNKAVIEFRDKTTAQNWYQSDEYQALIPLRNEAMESQFHLICVD